ncbi:hypothetical protein HDU93_003249 [Gonapodya sp. JEL0774]|nr:hypothetical protein HDU93_003249 [Gonapodya sp. JEL0774]
MASTVLNEILVRSPAVGWDDIVGLDSAKRAIKEIVVLPSLRPELFTGLRSPAKGVLLFGPPGTGKTMLARAIASEAQSTFFSISASSLTSKWVGESEKMVRALFALARHLQPSVIFVEVTEVNAMGAAFIARFHLVDEVDSILTERHENEHDASRRLKTEFLIQFDGVATTAGDRVLVLGATNRPQELDEAALRRFTKRIYIPLPEPKTRESLIRKFLDDQKHELSSRQVQSVVSQTDQFSPSDLHALAREASLGPIRELGDRILEVPQDKIRSISYGDFVEARKVVKSSVQPESVKFLESWNKQYGFTG